MLECPSCGHKNDTTTPFQDIPLNLPAGSESKEGLVFADLLAAVTAPETLDAQNLWTCGGCSTPVAAKKKVAYNSLPPVLFTHLKRTGYDQATQRRTKISTPVYFPSEFSGQALKPDFSDASLYKLKAILIHTGTAHGGHYKALVQIKGVWFEYDDSTVTELSKDEEAKLFWYTCPSDTEGRMGSSIYESAYMLMYQLADEATVALESEDISVPSDLVDQVVVANTKLQRLKKANAVHKMMTEVTSFKITADVGSHVKTSNIAPVPSVNFLLSSCSLQRTLETVHQSFTQSGILEADTDLSRCRLRRYNAASRMVGETFNGREESSLADLGLFPLCSLALEVVETGGTFADFNPKEVEVRVVEWKEGTKDDSDAKDVFILVSGEESASIGALRKETAAALEVAESRLVMLHASAHSNSHYVTLENDSLLLSDALVTSGDDVVIHILPEGEAHEGKGDDVIARMILEKRSISIMFNVPSADDNADTEFSYEKSVGVLLDASLGDLKELIAVELKLSVSDFHVRRNHSAPQLKALNKTLDVLNFVDHSIIHIQLGQQMAFGEFNMTLEADISVDEGDWKVVPEKKFLKLNDIIVKSRMSINQLKENIFKEWTALSGGHGDAITAPQSVNHLRLRDGQTGVQSGPLRGERIVSKCFLGLSDGRKIIVQVLPEAEIFGADQLYITNRIISFQNKVVSRPIGMQVNKGCTVQELFTLLLDKFPELNQVAGAPDEAAVEMYGDLPQQFPASRILAVAKAYNTGPPLSMKESLRLKWNDPTVVKDYTSPIDKLPFNIRDGAVLVLRSVADFEQAREAARARVADRPNSSSNFQGDSPARGRLRPGSRSRSRSGSRGKEKGITMNLNPENDSSAPNLPAPDGSGGAGIAAKSGTGDRKPMNLNEEMESELPSAPVRMVKVLRSPRPEE